MTSEGESSTDSPSNGTYNGTVNPAFRVDNDDITANKTPTRNKVADVDIKKTQHRTDCGLFRWRPWLLQKCNNSKCMLVVMCWFSLIQGFAVNGINNVNTTSLERRFFLSSTQVSLVSSSYDIAAGLFVIPIGYYGRLGHKPRWLSLAALSMACGSFIMTLPHFVTDKYLAQTNATNTCPADLASGCNNNHLSNYLYMFMAGQFLHGLGGTTLYTLGVTYLDENVKMHHSPIFIGIFEAFAAFGPALGYLIGGLFLNIYVDFDTVPVDSSWNVRIYQCYMNFLAFLFILFVAKKPADISVTIDSEDPRWVGAWWLGFLITAVGFLTISAMMSLFGWELPEAEENRKTRVSQAHSDGSVETFAKPDFGMKLKDLPKCTWLLLKNPTFVFLTAAGVLTSLCTSGLATFLPKFIQTQFSVAPSWGALLTGFVVIPGGILGQLAGGVIPGKLKWGVQTIIRYMCIVILIGTLVVPAFYLRCSANIMAGVTHQYKNSSELLPHVALENVCNAGCNCTTTIREPVCDDLGFEYFSACYAGCKESSADGPKNKTFSGCSCSAAPTREAKPGVCPSDCSHLPLFLFLLFVIIFCVMVCIPAGVVASIRCVPDNQGAYALALQWLFVRFLATIPGPILYGAIVDKACIVWQDRCAEADGSCWQYNQQNLAINFMSLTMAVCAIIVIAYFLAQFFYKAPEKDVCLDKQDKEVGEDNQAYDENGRIVTAL